MSDFQLIEADEAIKVKNIMVVLYGEPNTTKSSTGFTAENPILLDFDKGVHRAVGRKLVVKFKTWEEVQQFTASGIIKDRGIKTLIIDTAGVMMDDFIALFAMKQNPVNQQKGGGLSLKGFGAIKDVYSKFQAECETFEVDLVLLCHSTDQQEGDSVKKRPKMTGGSYDILKQKADLMGFMEMQNNKPVLIFSPTDRNVGKNAPGFPVLEIPHFTDPKFKTFLADIITKTKEHLNAMSEDQRIAVQKIETLNLQISDAVDITDLGDIEIEIATLSKPIQLQISKLYNEKYAVLWIDKFVKDKTTIEEFNEMVTMVNKLSKDLQKLIKNTIVSTAKTKGFMVNIATKIFEKDPNFLPPEPLKEEVVSKEDKSTKEKTQV